MMSSGVKGDLNGGLMCTVCILPSDSLLQGEKLQSMCETLRVKEQIDPKSKAADFVSCLVKDSRKLMGNKHFY